MGAKAFEEGAGMTGSVSRRRDEVLRLLLQSSPRTVAALAEELGVSAVTMRRDVDALAGEGRLRRNHGSVSALTAGPPSRSPHDRLTFGVIVPQAEYYFAEILQGVRAAAIPAGVRLLLGVSDYESTLELQLADRLLVGGVDGLLFAPTPDYDTGRLHAHTERWLLDCPVPVVLLDRMPQPGLLAAKVASVGADQEAGGAMAVQHLFELGHRRMALVCKSGPNALGVVQGYRSAAAGLGVDSAAEIVVESADDELADRLVQLRAEGVTALFVHNEQIAMALLARLDALGTSVPEELSLVCYDDVSAAFAHPPLTAVAPRKTEIGERAVALMLAALNDREPACEQVRLAPRLHARSSAWPIGGQAE